MKTCNAAVLGTARSDRRQLKLGTMLGSGALTAALLIPAAVQAAEPAFGRPAASVLQSAPTKFRSQAAEPAPQDLTVRPQDLTVRAPTRLTVTSGGGAATYSYGDVTTTTDNTPGIATTYAGKTTITAGAITTSGAYSDGVSANNTGAASPSPISVTVGNVSTSGNSSNGIYAHAYGDLAVTTGSVTTTGAMATGIYTNASGNTVIKASDITTSGAGVQANSGGTLSITVGNVTNSTGTGILASAGGDINITAGTVYSKTGTGISANSQNGDVTVNAGNVYATGGHFVQGISATGQNVTVTAGNVVGAEAGVYARAYDYNGVNHGAVNVTVNGEIIAKAVVGHGVVAVSDGAVNISTTGEISSTSLGFHGFIFPGEGILAIGQDNVTVNAQGRIKTYGRLQTGIYGLSYHGDVTINASAINTYGRQAFGVRADAWNGAATVVAGDITITGAGTSGGGTGIVAQGGSVIYSAATQSYVTQAGSVDVTLNGQIQAPGIASSGIEADAIDGNVAVHNNGSITLGDLAGTGIRAVALGTTGNVVVDGQGSITTGKFGGGGGYGVIAISQAGSVSVTEGAIATLGYGVAAIAENTYGNNAANGININVASVTTAGAGQTATGIAAFDYNLDSKVTINAGSVTTIGDYANGITASVRGPKGAVSITGGSISTRGKRAEGLALINDNYDTVTLDSVATTGLGAAAVDIRTNPFAGAHASIKADIGTISTAGDYAFGVIAVSGGTVNVQTGSVTTAGKQAVGVYAFGGGADGVTVDAGSVATAGDGADAIFARSLTGVSVTETGGITTKGEKASGVIAVGLGSAPVDLTLTGAISTQGGLAAGAIAASVSGAVDVQAGTISTSGGASPALGVYALGNSATVDISSASTSGDKSSAVFVKGQTGVTLTANQISTSGATANALIIRSGYYGVVGNATVNVGSISTTGTHSAGVDAFTVGRSSTDPTKTSTLSITVGSITTTGIDSAGISAFNNDGALNINASSISTQGNESTGILAFGGGDMNLQVGSISTAGADAIYATSEASGTITVGVSGKLASTGANGIVALNAGGATNITVASTGSVSGAGDAIQVQGAAGPVTITNAGSITGGTGFAIDVIGLPQTALTGNTQINNTGTIVGAVSLAGGNNTLTNAGTFVATKDSDFGPGQNLFVNTGVLKVGGAAPVSVSFLNLGRFENTGGLVDLRNGHAGDVLTLAGDYAASGDARIGLDVGSGAADKLVIQGTATGATTILLNGNAAGATLLGKPVSLVQAGAGSTGTFVIANPDVGLIHYALQPDGGSTATAGAKMAAAAAAPVGYSLTASAGAPVYATAKLEENVQTSWRQSADAWSEHLAAMRGDAWANGAASGSRGVWAQAFGSTGDRHGSTAGVSTDYEQRDVGVQIGADLIRRPTPLGDVTWGVTGGYTASTVEMKGGQQKSDVDTLDVGGYAALTRGALFANALVKYDRHQISASDSQAGYSATLHGNSYGAQIELGRRFGSDRFAFEPVAGLTWVHTSLDTATILNQTLAFQDADGLSGKIGGRVYGKHRFANGTNAVFYAGAAAVHDFSGDQRLTFTSGGTSQDVAARGEGTYGQAVLGVSARTVHGLSAYLEGDGAFGAGHTGTGLRLGARFGF